MNNKKNTKIKLLECACDVISEKGYHNTTIADISEKADANIAAVNYHFRNKETLYKEVIKHAIDNAEKYLPLNKGITDHSTPEEKLYAFINGMLRRANGEKPENNLKKITAFEIANPTEESGGLIHSHMKSVREYLLSIILEITDEQIVSDHHRYCVYSIMSQCLFFSHSSRAKQKYLEKQMKDLLTSPKLADHIYTFSVAAIRHINTIKLEAAE